MLVELRGITKRFGTVAVNQSIDFDLRAGEVHALLGENGAGKSTLMKILYGLYQPTEGEIQINGASVRLTNPAVAIRAGIGMVHQHFMLVPAFSVVENIALGTAPKAALRLDLKQVAERIRAISERYGLQVDPWARTGDLSIGAQQRVEILRTLYRSPRILIFDEPTAVLTPAETEQFLETIERLRSDGAGIIMITHKLSEVARVADRVSVLRAGQLVAKGVPIGETSSEELSRLMVGQDLPPVPERAESRFDEVILEAQGLTCTGDDGSQAVRGVDLTLRAGEILGLAGVDGNGQAELVEALAGLRPCGGELRLRGRAVRGLSTSKLIEMGLAHIPQDRHRMGLFMQGTVAENLALVECGKPALSRWGLLNLGAIRVRAEEAIKQWNIRPADAEAVSGRLSGGNQQKVVLARELVRQPAVILAAQPSRGLDVSATRDVHMELIRQRERGAAVLVVSTDLDEILTLSDRIGVMYKGQVVGYVPRGTDPGIIGEMMAGHLRPEGGLTDV